MDEGVALSALRNVATKTTIIRDDMRLNPSKYSNYEEMKGHFMEYAGVVEMELQVQKRTAQWKLDDFRSKEEERKRIQR